MRMWMMVLMALTGCGVGGNDSDGEITEDKFAEEFALLACDALHECDPAIDCSGGSGSSTGAGDCTFDAVSAQLCVDGAYSCDDSGGAPLMDLPDACLDVYTCGA